MIETLKQAKEAIAEIRRITGWTCATIGEKAGISKPAVYNIENGLTQGTLNKSTMARLDAELQRVKKVHG